MILPLLLACASLAAPPRPFAAPELGFSLENPERYDGVRARAYDPYPGWTDDWSVLWLGWDGPWRDPLRLKLQRSIDGETFVDITSFEDDPPDSSPPPLRRAMVQDAEDGFVAPGSAVAVTDADPSRAAWYRLVAKAPDGRVSDPALSPVLRVGGRKEPIAPRPEGLAWEDGGVTARWEPIPLAARLMRSADCASFEPAGEWLPAGVGSARDEDPPLDRRACWALQVRTREGHVGLPGPAWSVYRWPPPAAGSR